MFELSVGRFTIGWTTTFQASAGGVTGEVVITLQALGKVEFVGDSAARAGSYPVFAGEVECAMIAELDFRLEAVSALSSTAAKRK